MQLFIRKVLLFSCILLLVLIIGIITPPTPNVAKSFLSSQIEKDALLAKTPARRLILIGGSNLAFGINSKLLKDSLKLNPINTAITAGLGLKYMLDHTLRFVKPGDVVLVIPEYHQYYGNLMYGNEELLRAALDMSENDYKTLSFKQWYHIAPYLFSYSASKFNPANYLPNRVKPHTPSSVYLRASFNQYGDVTAHWTLKRQSVTPYQEIKDKFNDLTYELVKFKGEVIKKGGTVYVAFPDFQDSSFKNNVKEIDRVKKELNKTGITVLGNPYRYKFNDTLFYDTPYHLVKQGVDFRTKLLIQDIKPYITQP